MNAAADAGAGWRYGLLGAPVAFASVPLYVHLPHHYAQTLGWPLAALGTLLLASRLADALIDPLLGRWVDRLHARSPSRVLAFGAGAALVMALTLWLLFFPPWPSALQWPGAALTLLLACGSASALAIAHQGWGARLGGDALQRGRIVAWREGLGLAGVLAASVMPELAGYGATLALCALLLALGWLAWTRAPRPQEVAAADAGDWRRPWQQAAFRRLLAVFALNGIASAIPATLVLFYIGDRLQAAAPWPGLLLAAYFGAAAAALPLWLRGVARWAGVHLYSEAGDVLYATPELLSVHTVAGGPRTFRLPRSVEVVHDLYNDQPLARNTDSFEVTLAPASTALFYTGSAAVLKKL